MKHQRITLSIDDASFDAGGRVIVERALASTPGVIYVYIHTAMEMVYIEYDPSLSDPDHLRQVVERVGFHTGEPSLR